MKHFSFLRTIRGRIVACTGAAMALVAVVTVTVCFCVFQTFLRKNQVQSAEYNLQVISHNVENDMGNILYFSRWCSINTNISYYLERFQDRARMPGISSEEFPLRNIAASTYTALKEQYTNTPSVQYITKAVISPVNLRNYLQVSAQAAYGVPESAKLIHDSPFFEELLEAPDYRWIGFTDDPFFRKSGQSLILPIIRPIESAYSDQILGWSYLSVSSDLLMNYLENYPTETDGVLFVTIGDRSYLVSDSKFVEGTPQYTVTGELSRMAIRSQTQVQKISLAGSGSRIMVTTPLGVDGWSVSCILSEQAYKHQSIAYFALIALLLLVTIGLGILLTLALNRLVSRPIKAIYQKISAISDGDFSREPAIEITQDELGAIGRGINDMAENVYQLMNRRVEDERQKKDLEYQILQSQINPHFLYNTLNSIKWMATIQNASGIAEMTTSLARLMKNVAKGSSALIPLEEELNLVKDYVLIQQYRYGGGLSIEYGLESPELNHCLIHRFTLQPIVENALFHGIEPKGVAGKISITAHEEGEGEARRLLITVKDNGIGMDEETIRQVLSGDCAPSADFFRKVGLNNVNQRIRYDFGADCGLSIASTVGEYTAVTVTLRYKTDQDRE